MKKEYTWEELGYPQINSEWWNIPEDEINKWKEFDKVKGENYGR